MRRVLIIGGGLAGMTAAYELLKAGGEVVLLEASSRLGGKAGADRIGCDFQEHGNHFFPAWYLNTRRLLSELGLSSNLVDVEKLHHLRKGQFPSYETLTVPTRLSNVARNIFARALPWMDAALLVFSYFDLACQPDKPSDRLDLVTLDEFLASRPYIRDGIRECADAMVVKSIATSTTELSALTKQTIVRLWLRYRAPMYSILNTNLQDGFITPFENKLRELGCDVRCRCRVTGLDIENARIAALHCEREGHVELLTADDVILAVSVEAALKTFGSILSGQSVIRDLHNLRCVPMGAMTLFLRRPIPGLPKEHVILVDSKYALSFIDVSQTWPGCSGAVLTFNIGDTAPLLKLPSDEAACKIIDELRSFIAEIRADDIDRYYLRTNVDTPLLVNTRGSWRWRPSPGPTSLTNLHLAGDYCRSAVNVTSMEGAIASGIGVARTVLQQAGHAVRAHVLKARKPPRALLLAIRAVLYPFILLLAAARRAQRAKRWRITGRECHRVAGKEIRPRNIGHARCLDT